MPIQFRHRKVVLYGFMTEYKNDPTQEGTHTDIAIEIRLRFIKSSLSDARTHSWDNYGILKYGAFYRP